MLGDWSGGSGIIVLIYHSVAETGTAVSIAPRDFREQISWLADNFRLVSLDEALAMDDPGENVVVLTFDDGYLDYRTQALPILLERGIPSTVYVITELLTSAESGFGFSAGSGKKPMRLRDVEELRGEELVTIGSHTHTHRRLVGLSEPQVRAELVKSHDILQRSLGTDRIHFCFPWGVCDDLANRLVQERYVSAAIGNEGRNPFGGDPFALRRIPVRRGSIRNFRKRVLGRLVLERSLRRAKYWLATKSSAVGD